MPTNLVPQKCMQHPRRGGPATHTGLTRGATCGTVRFMDIGYKHIDYEINLFLNSERLDGTTWAANPLGVALADVVGWLHWRHCPAPGKSVAVHLRALGWEQKTFGRGADQKRKWVKT